MIGYHRVFHALVGEPLGQLFAWAGPPDTEVTGEISRIEIPAGTYALARFPLGEKEYQEAWNWVYGEWLPNSGYEPEDRPCFEMYLNDASEDPEGKSELDICIAVKPAS